MHGWGADEKPLYLSLNFAVNLKLVLRALACGGHVHYGLWVLTKGTSQSDPEQAGTCVENKVQ